MEHKTESGQEPVVLSFPARAVRSRVVLDAALGSLLRAWVVALPYMSGQDRSIEPDYKSRPRK